MHVSTSFRAAKAAETDFAKSLAPDSRNLLRASMIELILGETQCGMRIFGSMYSKSSPFRTMPDVSSQNVTVFGIDDAQRYSNALT